MDLHLFTKLFFMLLNPLFADWHPELLLVVFSRTPVAGSGSYNYKS